MGLISPAEENFLDFLELRQVLSTYDGDLRDPLWWPQEKDPSSRARRRKRGSSGCGGDYLDSSRVESGMSGNFLSCNKGVKDPLEVPEFRSD